MSESSDVNAVILDIEGTTTPIEFVYEVLFPYAGRKLKRYLEQHWSDPPVREDIDDLVDSLAGPPGADGDRLTDSAQDQGNDQAFRSAVIERIQTAMDRDDKHTSLKSLQGRIWRAGYQNGDLKAPIFDDVVGALADWQRRDTPVYIYSSGSVAAQKLLFEFSQDGDLRPYLSGYFDTRIGSKKHPASYQAISDRVGQAPGDLLFITDDLQEARAADEVGMKVTISRRPGNAQLDNHSFPVIESLGAVSGT